MSSGQGQSEDQLQEREKPVSATMLTQQQAAWRLHWLAGGPAGGWGIGEEELEEESICPLRAVT